MGDPRKRKKQYNKPRKSFQKERIEKERDLKKTYGLKNKKELLRAESTIRGKRANARKLLALDLENRLKIEKELVDSLKKIGVLRGTPSLDDVLVLTPEALLERRLQTVVWRKGLANTITQARQFITHGHIAVNGKKVTVPSYIVLADEEATVGYYGREMLLDQKKHVKKASAEKKNSLKEEFEEAKGTEAEVPEAKEIVEEKAGEEEEGKE